MATPLLDYAPPPPSSGRLRAAVVALLNAARRRARRLLAITACVLVALIPFGYASNSMSATACEKRVANWVATRALGGRAFYVGTGQNTDALTKLPGAVSRA